MVFKSAAKISHEYKCLSLIILNNKHFWPRQCESISAKTLMGLKHKHLAQQIFPCLWYSKNDEAGQLLLS